MNPISDTESEPDQNEPIVETLEKTKPKRKYTKKSKSVAPDGDSVPSVVKGNAIKEDAPLPEKPKRTRKAKASKDVAPDGDSVPPVVKGRAIKEDNPLPEPEPVKQKREPTQKQKEALEKAREKRRQQREELKAEIKEELKNEVVAPKVVAPKVVKEKTPKVVAFRPSQVDFV